MENKLKSRGVVSMILQMSRDSTDFYKGQTTWLVISFFYLSVMYISEVPWLSRKSDFQCHGNISDACVAECYNQHFSMPMIGVWNTVGLTVYSVFFMMEFSVFQNLTVSSEYSPQPLEEEPCHSPLYNKHDAKSEEMILNLSKEKFLLSTFLAYYVGQMAIQGIFLIIIWYYQLSLIKEDIWCHTIVCLGPYLCVFMGVQEKLMSITLITILSVIIIIFCFIFFLYTISLYALTSVILIDTKAKFQQLSE
ncbi:uncharacterized protein LOC119087562 [Peromyscus leucopus]|uniref:uncharacterized protein LOC119087562 n=1 Tax=Peromyscus leucopus TaxID=10041 RepID=UPI001885148F|nr:uncharacterized protein LOC119087562 [Peromyscus leucopus]XP_037059364.1 uncharacterized protein LOC119087562 [Peromyscus leucopus]